MHCKILPVFALFLLIPAALLSAQPGAFKDSLVRYHELTFVSDFEKQVFDQLRKKPDYNDALALLLASYPSTNTQMHAAVQGQVQQTLTQLK